MSFSDLFFLIFAVLGGLALFIFGMNVMTEGLRLTAGASLKTLLGKTTRNRFAGLSLGTALGTLVHSSATTVMLVGFVNAGLMTLEQSVAPILGCNIGTTISMQAISFKLDAYCFFAIAIGFIMTMALPAGKPRTIGKAIMGFGLLFLGMKTMGEAIKPHREILSPILSTIHGDTLGGLIVGILVTAALTAIWQSSGATIAMCFALVNAGVFTELEQVYPIVLGAHIGTCATALLGSIGTNIEARRVAITHLCFNIENVIMAVAAKPFFMWLVTMTSNDVNRQIANLHTAVMVTASAIVLPFAIPQAALSRKLLKSKKPLPEPSHLDEALLAYPEKALAAAIKELQRLGRLCQKNLEVMPAVILMKPPQEAIRTIANNEKVINEVNEVMRHYLNNLTKGHLSRRQVLLVQHLQKCVKDIERIGDHIQKIGDISKSREKHSDAIFSKDTLDVLFELYRHALNVIRLVVDSFDASQKKFNQVAREIMDARDAYMECSAEAKEYLSERVEDLQMLPLASIYFSQYMSEMDRIVRHGKMIALAELQPNFSLKRKRMNRHAHQGSHDYTRPKMVDAEDYLERLQSENL